MSHFNKTQIILQLILLYSTVVCILVWDVNLPCDYSSRLNLGVTEFVAADVAFHIIGFRKVGKAIFGVCVVLVLLHIVIEKSFLIVIFPWVYLISGGGFVIYYNIFLSCFDNLFNIQFRLPG